MIRLIRSIGLVFTSAALTGIILLSCRQERESDVGVRKPLPLSPTPTAPSPAKPAPAGTSVTTPLFPFTDIVKTTTTAETVETTQPADISPQAAQVFEEMDRAFADSKARRVSLRARIEMLSAVRGYRAQTAMEITLQFPNLCDVRVLDQMEINDRETTTAWTKSELRSGLLCDGKTLLIKRGFLITQKAPATLDDVLDEQIEIAAWGDNPIAACFLKTRPSTAFKKTLKRARVLQYTEQQIDLELVTAAPLAARERNNIPLSFGLVHRLTIDTRTMIPRRCYVDHAELGREIYRRGPRQKEIAVERAILEIVVADVNLKADFSGQNLFVIPKEASTKPGGALGFTSATIRDAAGKK